MSIEVPIRADIRAVSRSIASMIADGLREEACDLVNDLLPTEEDLLPEAFAAINVPTLSTDDWRLFGARIFGHISSDWHIRLATVIAARIGVFTFSFPKWRFPTQSFERPSLAESFGLRRLERDTDRNPDGTDLFGTGFCAVVSGTYIEFRRAYILVSSTDSQVPATVVIRNSSFHFGRDRLKYPAYVCWEPLSVGILQSLDREDMETSGEFAPWQDVLRSSPHSLAYERLRSVVDLMTAIDRLERSFDRWLRNDGMALPSGRAHGDGHGNLVASLMHRIRNGDQPVLGEVRHDDPPWQPLSVTTDIFRKDGSLTDSATSLLRPEGTTNRRLVMLSGQHGDLPG